MFRYLIIMVMISLDIVHELSRLKNLHGLVDIIKSFALSHLLFIFSSSFKKVENESFKLICGGKPGKVSGKTMRNPIRLG